MSLTKYEKLNILLGNRDKEVLQIEYAHHKYIGGYFNTTQLKKGYNQ